MELGELVIDLLNRKSHKPVRDILNEPFIDIFIQRVQGKGKNICPEDHIKSKELIKLLKTFVLKDFPIHPRQPLEIHYTLVVE